MLVATEHWQESAPGPLLRAGEVHLWRVPLRAQAAEHTALSSSEWLRAASFHFAADRERFVAGRNTLRKVLGGYLEQSPESLEFSHGAHGKPCLTGRASMLQFNLSHSGDLMLLAVAHAREIGVDLEWMERDVPFETLADHYFDPEDAWDLRLLPPEQRPWKFYDVWTCTEARLKAGGEGLSRGFSVAEPERWALAKFSPAAGYAAALAVEGSDFNLRCWSWLE